MTRRPQKPGLDYTLEGRCPRQKWIPAFAGKARRGRQLNHLNGSEHQPPSGCHFDELLDDPQALWRRVFRKSSPAAARQLADIDIAVPVDGHAVRRGELARGETGMHLAEPRQHLALGRMDADARSDIGPVAVDLARGAAFADIDERVAAGRHAHAVWPVQIVPLGLELAVAVKHLDPMVLAVGDKDPAVRVAADVVRDIELPRVGSGLAP